MKNENGAYIVMWHMAKRQKKLGLWNILTKKETKRLKPIMQRYETEEIAKYGYKNIKNNGGIKPYLLKVISE